MIDRRLFLKGLALSAAGAAIPLKSERELHRQIYDDPVVQTEGFGLAPVKREGSAMLYEAPADRYRHVVIDHGRLYLDGEQQANYLKPWIKDEDEWYVMTHRRPSYVPSTA